MRTRGDGDVGKLREGLRSWCSWTVLCACKSVSTLRAAEEIWGGGFLVRPEPLPAPQAAFEQALPMGWGSNFGLVCPASCLHGTPCEMDVGQKGLGIRPTFSRRAPLLGVRWRLREREVPRVRWRPQKQTFPSQPPFNPDEKGPVLLCSGTPRLTSPSQRSWLPLFWGGRGGN